MRRPRFVLREPIDFKALAQAFRLAKWKWEVGFKRHFPSETEVESVIKSLSETAKQSGYCASGGFFVTFTDGTLEVAIDSNIHAQLPVNTPGAFDDPFPRSSLNGH